MNQVFNKIGVASQKAVKFTSFINVIGSVHLACSDIKVDNFCHMYAKRTTYHAFSLFRSDSPCLKTLKYFFD